MVLLTVKGTSFPDEFIFECTTSTEILPDLAKQLCHIQNTRHQVKLQLLSARELLNEAKNKKKINDNDSILKSYENMIEEISTRLKDNKTPVTLIEFDNYSEKIRELTEQLFPEECFVNTGNRATAVEKLYELHDNPDISEEHRLIIYHCRAILDPKWKQHELQHEEKAGLWFCGKLMETTIYKYTGANEKSRLTVKVFPKDGPAPSMEPRINYEEQRVLFERMRQRREEFKILEESELRDRVVAQARGKVLLGTPDSINSNINTSKLRTIRPQKEEREVV